MENIETEIINKYVNEQKSLHKVAKELNVTASKVYWTLNKYKITARNLSNSHKKYNFDKNLFKKIDTEEKAYFLGFFYADGNVWNNRIQICLHPQDEEFLIKFKEFLKSEHHITNDREYKRFLISNQELANDFKKLGCHERKTFTLKFPNNDIIPESLIHHFMRGYFDGDGCIKYKIKSNLIAWRFEIISCYDFIQKYQEKIIQYCQLNQTSLRREPRREKPIYYMTYGSTNNKNLLKIFDFLYKDATIYLTRKYNKFIEINNKILERIEWRKLNPVGIPEGKLEEVKTILKENQNKSLCCVCKLLSRKDRQCVANLYKKFGIKRGNA